MKRSPIPPCVVIQDTREPSPDHDASDALFHPSVLIKGEIWALDVERAYLATGDYSLRGLEQVVTIERKTVGDLLGTFFGDRENSVGEAAQNFERFRLELERMRSFAFKTIVVEGIPQSIYERAKDRRFNPASAFGMLIAIHTDYGVPTVWAGNRSGAEVWVGSTLKRIWEQHHGGEAWRKAEARGYAEHIAWGPPDELARYRGTGT